MDGVVLLFPEATGNPQTVLQKDVKAVVMASS